MSRGNGLLCRDECLRRYHDGLARFAVPGNRNYMVTRGAGDFVNMGKAAGLSADEIIADAHGAGVTDRDGDIRTAWESCSMKPDDGTETNYTPRARKAAPPKPQAHPGHVRDLIRAGGGAARSGELRELSPCRDWIGAAQMMQTAAFMRVAFRPNEVLHVFRDDVATAGKPRENIRTAAEWVQAVEGADELPGDLIIPNPLTGEEGLTKVGKRSYIAKSCLAAFPYAILEMDDAKYAFGGDVARGLAMQCAFWRGFILKSKLAPALVALTYSGGKSIHGLLHVGAADLAAWTAAQSRLLALFVSDPESAKDEEGKTVYPWRLDFQALEPRQGYRIPGVRRLDRGTPQALLYLNPRARAGTMWQGAEPEPEPRDAVPAPEPMKPEPQPGARRCADCPDEIAAGCKRMFGNFWHVKSGGGTGCGYPVDEVLAAWREECAKTGQERPSAASVAFGRVVVGVGA